MEPAPFDVFLSHNSRDKPLVRQLAEQLRAVNIEPWLDAWHLTPGGAWQDEIVVGLRTSSACAVFVGPHGLGDWSREELSVALDRAAKDRAFRLFLVLLPGIVEPFDSTQLPPFLSTRTWVDLRRGINRREGFQHLVNAIKGVPFGAAQASQPPAGSCPYRGLQPFTEAEAEFFFGRDADIQRLTEKLKGTRFLAVLGSSGSGKSSLVRAGLVPALKGGVLPGSERWAVHTLTPGAAPLTVLASTLVRALGQDPTEASARTIDRLAADERTLHLASISACIERPPDERIVWVIDQAEEIFTLCHDAAQRSAFLANLLYAASAPGGRDIVILTMRADFYHRCAAYPDLAARLATDQFLVSPLDQDGLRDAIVEPVRACGLELEAGLVETILADVAERPGALPLLEHALLELWTRRRGTMLTLEGYRESGGVQGAVAWRAESIFAGLDADRQEIVRRSLLRLTQPGEGTEDTRRRATLAELVPRESDRDVVEGVVAVLADARLVTTSATEDGSGRWVDISHEALIRGWPRLRSWLDDDRSALRIHHRLAEAALEWQHLARQDDLLFRGARLAEAIEWREHDEAGLNNLERDFLEASVALPDRERRERDARRQRIIAGLTVGFITALVLLLFSGFQWWRAEEQRQLALAGQIAARAEVLRNGRAIQLIPSVALAVEALRRHPSSEAEQTLRRALMMLAQSVGQYRHAQYVQDVRFSPDGRLAASASADGTVRLWDVQRRQPTARLEHGAAVLAVAFSPDGRTLAAATAAGTTVLWNIPDGQERARLSPTGGQNGEVLALAIDPSGQRLATASTDGAAYLWDLATGQQLLRLAHDNQVLLVAFADAGRVIVTASADRTARLWDAQTGTELARLPHEREVTRLAASPDGRFVATGGPDGLARLWTLAGQEVGRFQHGREVSAVGFNGDGSRLLTASWDGIVHVWDTSTRQEITRLVHENAVNAALFSADGRSIATASTDGTARVWEPTSGQELRRMVIETAVWTVAFSPDGRQLITGTTDGGVRLWDTNPINEQARLTHASEVVALAFAPDGSRLATASWDHTARIWSLADHRELRRFELADQVFTVAWSPDGRFLAAGGKGGAGQVWDIEAGLPISQVSHDDDLIRIVFSPDGTLVATTSKDHTARLWRLPAGTEVARLRHEDAVTRIEFSPDGRFAVTASSDGTARIWDVSSGQEVARLQHDASVVDARFSPDGRFIATASWDRTARLWSVPDGRETQRIDHEDYVWSVAFSPDSTQLATTSTNGATRVVRVSGGEEIVRLLHDNAFVYGATFSADGQRLGTASSDRTARVWEIKTGRELARYVHDRDVIRVAFTPDQQSVVTGSLDGTARLWTAQPDDPVTVACARLTRWLTPDEWTRYIGDDAYRRSCPEAGT